MVSFHKFNEIICDDNFFLNFILYKNIHLGTFFCSIFIEQMDAKECKNVISKYCCETCHYNTSRKSSYDKHNLSTKHLIRTNSNNLEQKKCDPNTYSCKICNKIYKARNSLWYHEQKCKPIEIEKVIDNSTEDLQLKTLTTLVIDLMKSNHDLQKQMLDVIQKIQPGVTNTVNSHNNNNNKNFNLNFFLNEQCKDAMNIMDFVETFQLQFDDLERIGEVGYVEGISNLIIEKLNGMDIYKRPIHCSDAKREIMHIKDKGVWEKDNENNDKLRLAIKHITKKNIDLIGAWTEKYPGVRYSDHRLNDKFNEIIMEAMGGKNNKTMKEGEAKIIKKISKMVLIDKTTF
jgi:hypothetical protein